MQGNGALRAWPTLPGSAPTYLPGHSPVSWPSNFECLVISIGGGRVIINLARGWANGSKGPELVCPHFLLCPRAGLAPN